MNMKAKAKKLNPTEVAPRTSVLTVAPLRARETKAAKETSRIGRTAQRGAVTAAFPQSEKSRKDLRTGTVLLVQGTSAPKVQSSPGAPKGVAQSSPQTVKVSFSVLEPEAKRVSLCGAFNGWSPEATPMVRQQNGEWQATVSLPPGRHEYKLLIDGEWRQDPQAAEQVLNQLGTLNSVRVVTA
jgi:hypothetical protein